MKKFVSNLPLPYFLVSILLIAHFVPMITGVDFYPIQYYKMFSEIHKKSEEFNFRPFAITEDKTILTYPDDFNLWPINPVVFQYNLIKLSKNNWTEGEQNSFASEMLRFLKEKYPNKNIYCFGLAKETWVLAELEKIRTHDVVSEEALRFCQ